MKCLSATILVLLVLTETGALKMTNVSGVRGNEILDNYIPEIMSQRSHTPAVNDGSVPNTDGATAVEDQRHNLKSAVRHFVENEPEILESRKLKLKKMYMKLVLGLKLLALGVFLPAAVALSVLQSWKAVTLSLLALGLGAVLGIKSLLNNASSSKGESSSGPHHVVHSSWPQNNHHEHYWRTLRVKPEPPIIITAPHEDHLETLSAHDLAYRGSARHLR